MGLPINAEIAGRYVITHEYVGVNSKIIVTRLSDSVQQQLVMKSEWVSFFDGLCPSFIDMAVMEILCDNLFA